MYSFCAAEGAWVMSELTVAPSRHSPFPGRLGPDAIAAYAAATADHTPAVLEGLAVPAVFPVILVFGAQEAARADLSAAAWERARGGVHGEHDIVLHRPLVPGEPLDTWAQIAAVRTSRAGTHLVVHLEQSDAEGRIAVDQWWTMVLLGLHDVADLGTMPTAHRFPDDARAHPLGSVTQRIDKEVAHRYAEVSGDWAAHHLDIDVARAAGFRLRVHPRPVHDGNLHAPDSRHAGRRRSRPGCAGGRAVRFTDAVGRGADGECLWRRPEFVCI